MPRVFGEAQIGALLEQRLDRRRVERLGGAQQRRRADRQQAVEAAVVADIPERRRELQLRVRIRAGGEQLLDDLQAGRRIERRLIGPAAARKRVQVHRRIERRPPVPVPLARVRALLNQIRGEVEVAVEDRQQQRADLLRIGQVQIGAGVGQILRAVDAAFARRVQQRRQSARRPVNGARLGGDLPLPVVDRRPGVDVGAGRDERLHHRGLALGGRPHQRRLPAPLFHGVDLGAPAQQRLRRIDTAGARDDHQRGLTVGVRRLDVRAGLEQLLDHAPRCR